MQNTKPGPRLPPPGQCGQAPLPNQDDPRSILNQPWQQQTSRISEVPYHPNQLLRAHALGLSTNQGDVGLKLRCQAPWGWLEKTRKDIEKTRKDMTPDSGFLKQMDTFFSAWGGEAPHPFGGRSPPDIAKTLFPFGGLRPPSAWGAKPLRWAGEGGCERSTKISVSGGRLRNKITMVIHCCARTQVLEE